MWEYLEELKTSLSKIDNVKTVSIGLEANLSPDAYPCIRLVPSDIKPVLDHYSRRAMTVLIYFGLPLHESQVGIEEVTKQLFIMERSIRNYLKLGNNFKAVVKTTLFDEDRLHQPFKIMCLITEITGDDY